MFDILTLAAIAGTFLIAGTVKCVIGLGLTITTRQEIQAGPLIGTANGILTGMTGSFVVPGVMFLQSIGLSRDMPVQAMGLLFTASTLALGLALRGNNFLTLDLGTLSAAALVPAAVGMVFGRKIRQQLSEALFQQVFFIALLVLGAYIITNGVYGLR